MLSLAITVSSCRHPQWSVETFTYDNVAREPTPYAHPIPIYYLKSDVQFRYRIIGRAHATCTKIQTYQHPIPEHLLSEQARKVGGFALLAPKLVDDYTWTAPIIERID